MFNDFLLRSRERPLSSLIGCFVLAICWAWFAVIMVIWTGLAAILSLLALMGCSVFQLSWPPSRRRLNFLKTETLDDLELIEALQSAMWSRTIQKCDRERYQQELATLSRSIIGLDEFSTKLERPLEFDQKIKVIDAYGAEVGLVAKNIRRVRLEVNRPKLRAPTLLSPPNAFPFNRHMYSHYDIYESPFSAVQFLIVYPICAVVWALLNPFVATWKLTRTALKYSASLTAARIYKRLTLMITTLEKNSHAIAQAVSELEKFQADQRSVFQQTKSLRDELANELAAVKAASARQQADLDRLHEYVKLVHSRSEEMDRNDPMKEMRSLVKELKGHMPAGGPNV